MQAPARTRSSDGEEDGRVVGENVGDVAKKTQGTSRRIGDGRGRQTRETGRAGAGRLKEAGWEKATGKEGG